MQPDYQRITGELVARVRQAFEQDWSVQSIHGDCHRGNVLWRDEEGPTLVDLDDCLIGPAIADFWMLLDGDIETRRRQLAVLVEGYEQFAVFDWRQTTLMEPLRAARMLDYEAWIAHRWGEPAFAQAFPWFDQPRHWEEHLAALDRQLARMD